MKVAAPDQPFSPSNVGGAALDSPIGDPLGGAADQTQAAQALAAQATAAPTPVPSPSPSDRSGHGWSLNPLQDIGQIWHDVETKTIAPVVKADRWMYSNLISRPISTLMQYGARTDYDLVHGRGSFAEDLGFSGSTWSKSWQAAAHTSPGQGLVLAMNNAFSVVDHADGYHPAGVADRSVDPDNPNAVAAMFDPKSGNKNAWGNKIASGGVDAIASTLLDPLAKVGKVTKVASLIKDVPISKFDSAAAMDTKLNAPRSKAFNNWGIGKSQGVLSNHPMVKGTGKALNPYANQHAALLAGAKTPEEFSLMRQVMARHPQVWADLNDQADSTAKALDALAKVSPDAASQVANAFMPPEVMEKFALSADTWGNNVSWLQDVSKLKVKAAQDALNANADRLQHLMSVFGGQRVVTATTPVADRMAELRGAAKYANTRGMPKVGFIQPAFYNFPIRIYQAATQPATGLINHSDDDAVLRARSWLNRSSTLTPEQKNDFIQQYSSASRADRMNAWNSIENKVYGLVGDRYGLDPEVMNRLIQTTRQRGATIGSVAKSKAFGLLRAGQDELGVLPSADSEIIAHPALITQLEAGAVPMANLKQLETALDSMDRNGILSHVASAGVKGWDLLNFALDRGYQLWRPLSLITGHRAYNHIGDDWLRGAAKLGALATIDNAREGSANWLRNRSAQFTANKMINNLMGKHEQNLAAAKAAWEGTAARLASQKGMSALVPKDLMVTPSMVAAKKGEYDALKGIDTSFIQGKNRIGVGSFKIPGSNLNWEEAFGGPNGDYWRQLTSSQRTWDSMVDDTAHSLHSAATAVRGKNWGEISPTDDLSRHTRAYVHFIRNQMMPDPLAKMIIKGTSLDDALKWVESTANGRAYMRMLNKGDAEAQVLTVAEMVETYLPTDSMRDVAAKGRFSAKDLEEGIPSAGNRPSVHDHINLAVFGGDPTVGMLKRATDKLLHITGTLPDDIMVRHPVFNSLYKSRLTNDVQGWISSSGSDIIDADTANMLMRGARQGARKDMQGLLYDVSRFTDMGHMLRFVSPFFNAWFNAMGSWSKLFMENPGLIARTYEAKRALWDSSFSVNTSTGQPADDKTPLDQLGFVVHLPKALHGVMGGMTTLPISATKLVSPTYVDSIGSPGFGPLVTVPVNRWVKDHPASINSPIVKSMLGGFIDKNSFAQIVPSGVSDAATLVKMLAGNPQDIPQLAKTTWSVYQEQSWDFANGQRHSPPSMADAQRQAEYLTLMDMFVNRLAPLGFKPAPQHQFLVDQYRQMQIADPKNYRQNFYDKWGPAGMIFTQSLTTDPSGIPATAGAVKAIGKYKSLLSKYPELGAVIVGPEGNGNFDDLAYQWEVANGLRKALTPTEAAKQSNINVGWMEYGKARAALQAQVQARGLKSLNDPGAKDLKAQLSNFVSATGDDAAGNTLYNKDFYANYTAFNQNDYQNRLSAVLKIAQDPSLYSNAMRGDIRVLQSYSQLRDATYADLQSRTNKSIKSRANFDIARNYDEQVSQMISADTRFAQLYERYLSKDDFKEPI